MVASAAVPPVGSVQSCEWSVVAPLSKVIAKGIPNTSIVWSGDTANVVYPLEIRRSDRCFHLRHLAHCRDGAVSPERLHGGAVEEVHIVGSDVVRMAVDASGIFERGGDAAVLTDQAELHSGPGPQRGHHQRRS